MPKIILILLVGLFGCSDNQTNPGKEIKTTNATNSAYPVKPLVINNGEEEGWGADIRLSVINITENDTAKVYKAVSDYENKKIGLIVSVLKNKEGDKGFGKGLTLKSIGEESDYLLLTLLKLYKQKIDTSIKFINSVSVDYVNLNEFAKTLGADGSGPVVANEYKLFFQGQSGEDYAELYLNINPDEHWIELREKDEEYRPLIIKFLKK